MNKAIFLDRDGIINIERGTYTYDIADFIFVDGIINNLIKLQNAGYLLIIITNQGGISKNVYRKETLMKLHNYLLSKLKENGISLTDIYYCPHHSDNEACICRKPDNLMLEKAVYQYNIDPSKSFFIGDRNTDVKAAEKSGINGILVRENQNISEITNKIINL